MSGFIPKRVCNGRMRTKTNQTGLNMQGSPASIGRPNYLKRSVSRRVQTTWGLCGFGNLGFRCMYEVDPKTAGREAIKKYCIYENTRTRHQMCLNEANQNTAIAGGVGRKNVPRLGCKGTCDGQIVDGYIPPGNPARPPPAPPPHPYTCLLPLCQRAMRKCLISPSGESCSSPQNAPITSGIPGQIWAPCIPYKMRTGVCAAVAVPALNRVNICVGGDFFFQPPSTGVPLSAVAANSHLGLVRDRWDSLGAQFQDSLSAAGFFSMWLHACGCASATGSPSCDTPPRMTLMLDPAFPGSGNTPSGPYPSSWIFVQNDAFGTQVPQPRPLNNPLSYPEGYTFVCRIVWYTTDSASGYSGVDYVIQSDKPFYCSPDKKEDKACCGQNAKYQNLISAPIYFCGDETVNCDGSHTHAGTVEEAVTRTDGNLLFYTRRWM